ncbi:MAG: hypothetical protein EOO59_17550 [Hymenobacter sp.]|nr:MAG: hypothetical protein EOO59_17550 [Hymenobacter sp.]
MLIANHLLIPLATLYYLLCYAWQRLPEPTVLQAVDATPFHRPLELLTQMLLHAARPLLRAGLPLGYVPHQQEVSELRGRVQLAPTLGQGLLLRGRAMCEFDELSPDRSLARLLAGTLAALATLPALPLTLRREVSQLRRRLPAAVQPQLPTAEAFAALRRQRLPAGEAFILHICELIYETALPAPQPQGAAASPTFGATRR